MSSIFEKDETPISSSYGFSGFQFSGTGEQAGDCATFVRFMSYKIYERIFQSSLNSLAMTKAQSDVISPSATDSYSPRTLGFIRFLSLAASKQSNMKIWGIKLSDGTWIFNDKQPQGEQAGESREFELDFSSFDESKVVRAACSLMFQVLTTAAKGIKASETVLVKLENLVEQVAEKKTKKALKDQLAEFEKSVRDGKLAFLSGGSSAEFMTFDIEPSNKGFGFCFSLISMVTGYPLEFFNGVGGSSLSDTGQSTDKAIKRANAHYSSTVINPFIDSVFGFRLEEWPEFEDLSALIPVITFIETTEILTTEDKKKILMSMGLSGEGVENAVPVQSRTSSDKANGELRDQNL